MFDISFFVSKLDGYPDNPECWLVCFLDSVPGSPGWFVFASARGQDKSCKGRQGSVGQGGGRGTGAGGGEAATGGNDTLRGKVGERVMGRELYIPSCVRYAHAIATTCLQPCLFAKQETPGRTLVCFVRVLS